MNAVANVAPREVAQLCNLVRAGQLEAARTLHYTLFELMKMIFWDTNPIPLKYLMMRLGLLERNEHRLPYGARRPRAGAPYRHPGRHAGPAAAMKRTRRPPSSTHRRRVAPARAT